MVDGRRNLIRFSLENIQGLCATFSYPSIALEQQTRCMYHLGNELLYLKKRLRDYGEAQSA